MKTILPIFSHSAKSAWLKDVFLLCGILSSLLYVAMNIFIAIQDPAYHSASQTVSELSALNAPTRNLWVAWSFVYTFLAAGFGLGVWLSAGANRKIRVLGVLIFFYGALGLGWPFAPMHTREVLATGGGTMTDTMHIVFSMVTILLMMLAIVFGGMAFGKHFRYYSIFTIVILVLFGILTGSEAPSIDANQPTPHDRGLGTHKYWSFLAMGSGSRRCSLTEANEDWGKLA